MKYSDVLEEAQKEVDEELKAEALTVVKERLFEIEQTKQILKEMEVDFESLLDQDI